MAVIHKEFKLETEGVKIDKDWNKEALFAIAG